jgi:uncharacterized protein (TIGR02246 family)
VHDVNEAAFRHWLDRYGAAWEGQDPDAAAAIFAADGTYAWGPFDPPIAGRAAIREAWDHATRGQQQDIRFGYEVLAVTAGRGIARWWAAMTVRATGKPVRMEGIFLVTLDEQGLCEVFREWWNEDPPATGASAYA